MKKRKLIEKPNHSSQAKKINKCKTYVENEKATCTERERERESTMITGEIEPEVVQIGWVEKKRKPKTLQYWAYSIGRYCRKSGRR